MLAISGLLEWTYLVILVVMIAAAGVFSLYLFTTLFRNPSRR